MANGVITTDHVAAVTQWSNELQREIADRNPLKAYMSESADSIIRVYPDLQKAAGDNVKIFSSNMLAGKPWKGTQSAKERAESLTYRYDEVKVEAIGHTVKFEGLISQQRVKWKIREQAKDELAEWATYTLPVGLFLHLAGIPTKFVHYVSGATESVPEPASPTEGSSFVFGSLPVAPTTGRIVRAGARANDESLTTADVASLSLLDSILPLIQENRPRMQPPYVWFISPAQAGQITSTRNSLWEDMQMANIQAGKPSGLTTYQIGRYKGVDVVVTPYIPRGIHSSTGAIVTNSRRSVLCGRQAISLAFGSVSGAGKMWNWEEDEDRIERLTYIGVQAVLGAKKTQFKLDTDANNFSDYGTYVISTYA